MRADAEHAVVVRAPPIDDLPLQHADEQFHQPLCRLLFQLLYETLLQFVAGGRERRLRPHHHVHVLLFQGQTAVALDDLAAVLGRPFLVQGHIALDQRGAQRFALGLHPGYLAQGPAAAPQQQQHAEVTPGAPPVVHHLHQQSGADDGDQAQPVNTQQGRIARQGSVDLAVAEIEPRKPGQKPSAHPFQQHPQRGQQCQRGPPGSGGRRLLRVTRAAQARLQPTQ